MSEDKVLETLVEVAIKLLLVVLIGSNCGNMVESWGYPSAAILIGITMQATYYCSCLYLETKLK